MSNNFIRANSIDIRHGVGLAALTVQSYAAEHPDASAEDAFRALAPLLDELSRKEHATCASCGQPIFRRIHEHWVHGDEFESRRCASAARYDEREFSGTPSAVARPSRQHVHN